MFRILRGFFVDDAGDYSCMRLLTFTVTAAVLGTWVWANLTSGHYVPLGYGECGIVTAALASKAGQAKFEYGTPQISDSGLQPPATGNHGAGAEASAPAPKPCNLEPNGGHDE